MGECTCQKTPEGLLGWDRSMIDPECSQHGCEEPLSEFVRRVNVAIPRLVRRIEKLEARYCRG